MKWRPGLRSRLSLMSAAAVAIAIAAVSVLAWFATARTMREQVDRTLTSSPMTGQFRRAQAASPRLAIDPEQTCTSGRDVAATLTRTIGAIQLVRSDGSVCAIDPSARIPVTPRDLAVTTGAPATAVHDTHTENGAHFRTITLPITTGYALMISRDLTETDNTLRTLALALAVASGLGTLVALTAGWVVARAGLSPLNGLTRAAEHVAATTDLNVPIAATGDDEVARLAKAFNQMTTALEAARARQQQLITDASHELRTPLTSLRTNIELLMRSEDEDRALPPADRRDLLRSLSGQLQELTQLTGELSLLSHDETAPPGGEVQFDDVVRRAVERAARRGDHTIRSDLHPWHLTGHPAALERAVLNLLDNAIKFSPPRSTIQVRLYDGTLTVADQGPGIPEAERPQVFQRFWRSPSSRGMTGSGLGLAIVADVVSRHGGQVDVGAGPTGGTVVHLRLGGRPGRA